MIGTKRKSHQIDLIVLMLFQISSNDLQGTESYYSTNRNLSVEFPISIILASRGSKNGYGSWWGSIWERA